MYRHGDADAAIDELARWDERTVRAAALAPETASAADDGLLRAIAVLHLEAVMRGAPHGVHFDAATTAFVELRRRGAGFDFLRRWYVAGLSLMMSRGTISAEMTGWQLPDAELLLVDGSRLEATATAISILDEYDLGWHTDIGGRFKEAERKYRQALSLAPSLLEARLRLGRVLTLTGRLDEARLELEHARREASAGYLGYLADLFLGEVHERAGRPAAAAECYEAAIREYPDCQTAYLALGHLREMTGDRERGSATVRDLFGGEGQGRTANPQHDPWWVYWYAQYWQINRRMAELRAMVRR